MMILTILLMSMSNATEIPTKKVSAFKAVPKFVVEALKKENCAIPQAPFAQPNNLISGEFAKKGQTDWAALCLEGDQSKIFVVWGGSSKCPSELRSEKNSIYSQELGNKKMEFSRGINAVTLDKKILEEKRKQHGGAHVPEIDHQGLNDAFVEKASEVAYCHQGRWLDFLGAD